MAREIRSIIRQNLARAVSLFGGGGAAAPPCVAAAAQSPTSNQGIRRECNRHGAEVEGGVNPTSGRFVQAARATTCSFALALTIAALLNLPHDFPVVWLRQITDDAGFEIIYVAALCSVGVPSQLNSQHQAEFWAGTKWDNAPRASVVSW